MTHHIAPELPEELHPRPRKLAAVLASVEWLLPLVLPTLLLIGLAVKEAWGG